MWILVLIVTVVAGSASNAWAGGDLAGNLLRVHSGAIDLQVEYPVGLGALFEHAQQAKTRIATRTLPPKSRTAKVGQGHARCLPETTVVPTNIGNDVPIVDSLPRTPTRKLAGLGSLPVPDADTVFYLYWLTAVNGLLVVVVLLVVLISRQNKKIADKSELSAFSPEMSRDTVPQAYSIDPNGVTRNKQHELSRGPISIGSVPRDVGQCEDHALIEQAVVNSHRAPLDKCSTVVDQILLSQDGDSTIERSVASFLKSDEPDERFGSVVATSVVTIESSTSESLENECNPKDDLSSVSSVGVPVSAPSEDKAIVEPIAKKTLANGACVPESVRVYAIGDIHGQVDQLRRLHQTIRADAAQAVSGTRLIVVYLGDYVDRGLYSRDVIDLLLDKPLAEFERVHLKGNHEHMFLEFLQDSTVGPQWFSLEGSTTVRSYGVSVSNGSIPLAGFSTIQKDLCEAVSKRHADFLSHLQLSWEIGDYFFVHAGIRPGRPLDEQTETDLLWIRRRFLDSTANHGKIIVHGHSVTDEPDLQENRIGIDTGAYVSNNLTCLVLEGAFKRFLSTACPETGPYDRYLPTSESSEMRLRLAEIL